MAKLNTNYRPHKIQFLFGDYFLKYKIGAAMALFIILGAFYILEVNRLAILSYEIKKSEKKYQTINKDTEKLQLEVEKMKMVANLRQKAESFSMIESKKVDYIDISSGGLVLYDGSVKNP